jgi:serine/threonine-protein kinase
MPNKRKRFRRRQRLGQYRVESCLAVGGFAEVYQAYDTIEGVRVALKIPLETMTDRSSQRAFRKEVQLVAGLDHPNILKIKTASVLDGHFVVVTALAKESLADRLSRRMGRATALAIAHQLCAALAYAHKRRIIHCDVKPENILLFGDGRVRLADFGLAKVSMRSVEASGSGTLGYMAPEQALGRPSPRSDVFSAALVLYRMMAGKLPEWPFSWPYVGIERARRNYHHDLLSLVRRATDVDQAKRPRDAAALLSAFEALRPRALRDLSGRRSS